MSGKLVCLVKGFDPLMLLHTTTVIGAALHLLEWALFLLCLCVLTNGLGSGMLSSRQKP